MNKTTSIQVYKKYFHWVHGHREAAENDSPDARIKGEIHLRNTVLD